MKITTPTRTPIQIILLRSNVNTVLAHYEDTNHIHVYVVMVKSLCKNIICYSSFILWLVCRADWEQLVHHDV